MGLDNPIWSMFKSFCPWDQDSLVAMTGLGATCLACYDWVSETVASRACMVLSLACRSRLLVARLYNTVRAPLGGVGCDELHCNWSQYNSRSLLLILAPDPRFHTSTDDGQGFCGECFQLQVVRTPNSLSTHLLPYASFLSAPCSLCQAPAAFQHLSSTTIVAVSLIYEVQF
jgi:hypothetical protein